MMDIIFLHPWILAALFSLPAIYLLLRVMPPQAQRVILPTLRFLQGLTGDKQTPHHTPWWILLLRLLMATLIILALAGPVHNPAVELSGSAPIRIVFDNSWAAAQNWDNQMRAAKDLASQAGRQNRQIYILTTAPENNTEDIRQSHAMPASQALSFLSATEPRPWPANYKMAASAVNDAGTDVDSFWFGHGVDEGNMARLARALAEDGSVSYFKPQAENLPIALRHPRKAQNNLSVEVLHADTATDGTPITLQVLNEKGRVLDQQSVRLAGQKTVVSFAIDEAFRGQATQIRALGKRSAGSVLILDENAKRRHVGILAPAEKAETSPFIEASYYLKRALSPYSDLSFGNTSELLQKQPSLIVMPDIGAMPPETLDALEQWVHGGGVLVRFAGPNMVKEADNLYLSPVDIRSGGRAMDGAMTWENPATVAPFDNNSPFYGMRADEEIVVRRQLLAEPSPDLEQKTWARLSDGTPLITADEAGDGLLVLIHTTATPAWSDLSISGTYVEILRKLVALSGQDNKTQRDARTDLLHPIWVLDGYGVPVKADGSVQALNFLEREDFLATPTTPPGLYGDTNTPYALNIGDNLSYMKTAEAMHNTAQIQNYSGEYEQDLMPYLLLMATILFAIDWAVMLFISSGLRWRLALLIAFIVVPATPALAASKAEQIRYSNALYVAYIKTGDVRVDLLSNRGLNNLATALNNRTSAEPDGVVGIDIEKDDLLFFPFIYWPITTSQPTPSALALEKVQHYLDHGGTILFDKRQRASQRHSGVHDQALQQLIGSLNIPPLHHVPKDHVLSKSFYLLDRFPGLYSGDALWVEKRSSDGRDGVSSVIIGSHDWASAWANAERGRSATRQYELSLRFGINLMMYSLTGNYKADQVHLPAILERLGE